MWFIYICVIVRLIAMFWKEFTVHLPVARPSLRGVSWGKHFPFQRLQELAGIIPEHLYEGITFLQGTTKIKKKKSRYKIY